MISIILTGHGYFADGIFSAVKLVTGMCDAVTCVNFPETDSTDDLHNKLKTAILQSKGDVLILADMVGGSPFKESAILRADMTERRIEIVSGCNLPMAIDAVLEQEGNTMEGLISNLMEDGKLAVSQYIPREIHLENTDDFDGI